MLRCLTMWVPGAIALMAVIAGCSSSNPAGLEAVAQAVTADSPAAGDESGARVELRLGQTVVHDGLELRLLEIEDSRCPTGVACVWEGQVTVRLEVALATEEPIEVELILRAGQEPRGETAYRYVLRLLSVDPHPKGGVTIPRDAYLARVEIESV